MLSEQFKQLVKGGVAVTGWISIGVLSALILAKFQGELEVRVGEEGYLRVKGPPSQCQLIDTDWPERPN